MLESKIVSELKNSADPCINIQAEKSVPIEYVVRIMNIAKRTVINPFWRQSLSKILTFASLFLSFIHNPFVFFPHQA